MNKRDHAVALATKGFRIFPCEPNGKKPLWPVRVGKETSDPVKAHAIWTEAVTGDPLDYNIGINTDDLFVFDIDSKGGADVFAEYQRLHETYLDAARGDDQDAEKPTSVAALTPSGGLHIYTRLKPDQRAANSAKTKFGLAVDTRSWHGYVLAPGSSINGNLYSWLNSGPDGLREPATIDAIAYCPDAVIEAAGRPADREHQDLDIAWDEPSALAAANAFIRHAAPAIQGQGGNDHTYRIAARLRQFGVSAESALDVMLPWNTACEPPWQIEDLVKVIDNAYRYAKNTPRTPGAEFEHYALPEAPLAEPLAPDAYKSPDWPTPSFTEQFDIDGVPKRQWIIPGLLAKGFVTGFVAPSGAGKTQFMVQMALALTSGKQGLLTSDPLRTATTWIWNQEDDLIELRRRMSGAMRHFKIGWNDITSRLAIDSGVDKALMLVARDTSGNLRETKRVSTVVRHMIENKIEVLVVDPLIEFHEAEENNNVEMRIVAAALRRIAVQANAAVIVGHHTKKPDGAKSDGFAGNADSGRGASALQGVTRIMATLYAMSEADAKKLRVKPEHRWRYVRFDGAKSNISASSSGSRPEWLERVGQAIGHEGDTEEIGVLVPVDLMGSRVMREAEEAHEKLEAKSEEKGKTIQPFEDAHPFAVALANLMQAKGIAQKQRTHVSVLRAEAAESLGESPERYNRFGKWCFAQTEEPIPAGNCRWLIFSPAVAARTSARVAWVSMSDEQDYLD